MKTAASNSRQVVRLLLRKGANVHTKGHVENNKNSRMEWSPLHIATLAADAMIVGLLVEAGADVHEKMQGDMDSSYLPLTTESFIDRAVRMFEGQVISPIGRRGEQQVHYKSRGPALRGNTAPFGDYLAG